MSALVLTSWPSAVRAFRLLFVAFIILASATTFLSAWSELHATEHSSASPLFLALLAGTEIVAAVLFAFRRPEIPAAVALIIVFGIAEALSIASKEITLRFVFYAGTVLFILAAARRDTEAVQRTTDQPPRSSD